MRCPHTRAASPRGLEVSVSFLKSLGIRPLVRGVCNVNSLPMDPLDAMLQHRSITFAEYVESDVHDEVEPNPEYVCVERSVVEFVDRGV